MSDRKNTIWSRPRKWLRLLAGVAIFVFALEASFLAIRWPFSRERIAESLGRATGTKVTFRSFDTTFLPSPGCVVKQVSFRRGQTSLASVEKLRIQGSWLTLLAMQRYVPAVVADGLEVNLSGQVPPPVGESKGKEKPTTIGTLTAHGAVLKLTETQQISFPKLSLRNAAKNKQLHFDTEAKLPTPAATVRAQGSFGPWTTVRATPVQGQFNVHQADLSTVGEIRGMLTANGKFEGPLGAIRVHGSATTPDFAVKRHATKLQTQFRAVVNATNGDIHLPEVRATFRDTELQASGSIVSRHTSIEIRAQQAWIEDLLLLFTSADKPALTGPIQLRTHVELPPTSGKFLSKLNLDGQFGIGSGRFTRNRTQAKVNELSARARGRDTDEDDPPPEHVVSDLRGRVSVRDGVAHLEDVSFRVPGAAATGAGRYNLLTKEIALEGKVHMQAELSEAAGGIKGFFLKPFNSLFHRNHRPGAVLPVRVTGRYPHARFIVSPTGR